MLSSYSANDWRIVWLSVHLSETGNRVDFGRDDAAVELIHRRYDGKELQQTETATDKQFGLSLWVVLGHY
jgi:hypothetical protein